jgi:hypothetical protein
VGGDTANLVKGSEYWGLQAHDESIGAAFRHSYNYQSRSQPIDSPVQRSELAQDTVQDRELREYPNSARYPVIGKRDERFRLLRGCLMLFSIDILRCNVRIGEKCLERGILLTRKRR